MTLSIWQDSPAEKVKEEFDVAIIGGGIVGASAAYWLSQRPNISVTLLESGRLASGASGRNAGFVLRGIQSYYNQTIKGYGRQRARDIYTLAEESQRHLREFIEKVGNSCDYVPSGSYLLACSLEELQDLSESAELMREDGFAVEYLKDDPLDRDYYGALANPGDFGLHPVKLVAALVEAGNVVVRLKEAAIRIDEEERGTLTVQTSHRIVRCRKVLMATNAYTPLLEPWFKDRIQPARGQILVTQPLKKRVLERICYANYGWEYFRQLPDNRFLLGGCREHHYEEEVGYAEVPTQGVQTSLESYLRDRFPDVAGVPVDYRWAGLMGFTKDGLPMVGELKSIPGCFFAVGCNGHGMGYGPVLAKLMVELALDGKDPGMFAADRTMS